MSKYQELMAAEWKSIAYCLGLVERMYPNYELFVQVANFGDSKVARNILDVLWGQVAGDSSAVDFNKQLDKVEIITPKAEDFDFFGVRPAIDFCVALSMLVEVCALVEPLEPSSFDRIDDSTIAAYLDAIDYVDHDNHPLFADSLVFKDQLSALLTSPSCRKASNPSPPA